MFSSSESPHHPSIAPQRFIPSVRFKPFPFRAHHVSPRVSSRPREDESRTSRNCRIVVVSQTIGGRRTNADGRGRAACSQHLLLRPILGSFRAVSSLRAAQSSPQSVRCARARKCCTLSQDRAAACLPSSLPFSLPIFFGRIVKKERAREEGLESFGHRPPSILVNSLGKLVLLVVHIRILFIFIIRLLSSSCLFESLSNESCYAMQSYLRTFFQYLCQCMMRTMP